MTVPSRLAIVLWSAVPGLVLGLLVGGGAWTVLALVRQWIPAVAPHLQRAGPALAIVCLGVVPLAGVVLGALEGWLKRR